jgi:hypothetical protein
MGSDDRGRVRPAVMAARGWGDAAMAWAGAIVRPLVGGLMSIFVGCLSWAAGLGDTGLWALRAEGVGGDDG